MLEWFFKRRSASSIDQHLQMTADVKVIAIVGNAPVDPAQADDIDRCDWIVRINKASNCGVAGQRTDTLAIPNHGRPARQIARKPAVVSHQARKQTRELLFAVDPSDLPPPYSEGFSDGHGEHSLRIARKIGKDRPFYYVPSDLQPGLIADLRACGSKHDVLPSTGAVVINFFHKLHPQKELRLFGFTHQGWEGHCWEAERAWVEGLPGVVKL